MQIFIRSAFGGNCFTFDVSPDISVIELMLQYKEREKARGREPLLYPLGLLYGGKNIAYAPATTLRHLGVGKETMLHAAYFAGKSSPAGGSNCPCCGPNAAISDSDKLKTNIISLYERILHTEECTQLLLERLNDIEAEIKDTDFELNHRFYKMLKYANNILLKKAQN